MDARSFEGPTPLRGRVRVPGCKGISHRALLFAAMADGRSNLLNLAPGDDVVRTRGALAALGVTLDETDGSGVTVAGRGVDGLAEPADVLDCGNSGTTMRMLAGLLAGRSFLSVLAGDRSLSARPMSRVVDPLQAMGAAIDGRDHGRLPPLAVRGGALHGTRHELAVASGQVHTALVLAGLQADGTTEIVEPAPSRDHTGRLLHALGAPVEMPDATTLRVRHGRPSAFELEVPGDASSAAFFVVAATVIPGSHLVIEGVSLNPGRTAYVDVLRAMGANVEIHLEGEHLGEPFGTLEVRATGLHGTTIVSAEAIVDELPVLAVAAAFAEGVTQIQDAAELRVKESDRIAALADLLFGLGVGVEAHPDGLVIRGGRPRPAHVDSAGDHRIAMAAAVAATAVVGRSTVDGWDAVTVSYPGFADDLARVTRAPS
jgi:3-phosphoshikimate 1-carboxyvinyltransferase